MIALPAFAGRLFTAIRALRLCEGHAHRMDACKKQESAHDIG